MNIQHIHCPVNAWDCPYYTDDQHECRCTLEDPMRDCDDFAAMWGDNDDYIDNDWEEDDPIAFEYLRDLFHRHPNLMLMHAVSEDYDNLGLLRYWDREKDISFEILTNGRKVINFKIVEES